MSHLVLTTTSIVAPYGVTTRMITFEELCAWLQRRQHGALSRRDKDTVANLPLGKMMLVGCSSLYKHHIERFPSR